MKKFFLKFIGCLGILIAFLAISQVVMPSIAYAGDDPCLHGMRVVGDKSIYLSHMGLFNSNCHDYQALFEVGFTGANNPEDKYLIAQNGDPEKNEFTLRPKNNFVLSELGSGKNTSFKADIFEGQYERLPDQPPKPLISDVNVNIKRVIHFRAFNPNAKISPTLEYLLFGNSQEQYVAHKIIAPNDFDQILAAKNLIPLTDNELNKALTMVFPNRPTPNESEMFRLSLKSNDPQNPAIQINGKGNQKLAIGVEYFKETRDYKKTS